MAEEIQTQRIYRSLHGSPMLGGLPILGTLSMLGVVILGTFTVKAISGLVAAGVFILAGMGLWSFLAYLYGQDRVFMPMFIIKMSTRFAPRIDSYAPSAQDWGIED
jgi:hypothetical protein